MQKTNISLLLMVLIIMVLVIPFLVLNSCAVRSGKATAETTVLPDFNAVTMPGRDGLPDNRVLLPAALDELAELERSGGFVPGLGLAESKLREDAGDYSGAVLAVYKELSWAYAVGAGDVTKESIRQGLEKLLEENTPFGPEAHKEISLAVRAILAYFDGRYDIAEELLINLYGKEKEVDGFSRFMILVCSLEKGTAGREERSTYGAIRARYAGFPEYWYRYARSENANGKNALDESPNAASTHAERCINLAPEGPYAAECRIIMAKAMGLKPEDAPALKTRSEIDAAVTTAVNQRNPDLLLPLLPLTALPDNPSTLYASGAMRALAGESLFRIWFSAEAEKARGRLAERLLYISRG
ncbi:MAG: hypothetical protein FWG29_02350 [Treponema sp.]|nr:hypothetical protein [Treponema sp.]